MIILKSFLAYFEIKNKFPTNGGGGGGGERRGGGVGEGLEREVKWQLQFLPLAFIELGHLLSYLLKEDQFKCYVFNLLHF